MNTNKFFMMAAAVLPLAFAGCQNDGAQRPVNLVMPQNGAKGPQSINLIPQAIPGGVKADNDAPTGAYAPTKVEAQLKIDVKEGTKEVRVVRDNTDPIVITRPYQIKNADPYAVRSYLEAAVGAKSISANPAQVTAVKFDDGTGVILVSAEDYRFEDSKDGKGISAIVAKLDRKGLTFFGDADASIYFPKYSRAANLRDMLIKVGSSELDPQFAVAPGSVMVDGELNALILSGSKWNVADMRKMLAIYDRQIPEVKVRYKVLEIYAENDDRIGVDFQSWKNNEGVDLFSAGTLVRRNWGTFFTSNMDNSLDHNRTSYWNFNPKWNTRYLDFMTSIGKAKVLAQGELVVQNRVASKIQVGTGFFYDRTYYTAGAKTIAEGCTEFAYTDVNPDTILRESVSKIMPINTAQNFVVDAAGINPLTGKPNINLAATGYTMRMMGVHTGTNTYTDVTALATRNNPQFLQMLKLQGLSDAQIAAMSDKQLNSIADSMISPFAKYLTGYTKADGTTTSGNYYNTNGNAMNAHPGIIHGWLQYPMVKDGFLFEMAITPVVTGKAAKLQFDLNSISLLGWNSDGSPRSANSQVATTMQMGYKTGEFVIGGLRKSESVRGTTGLPFFKDLPVIGRIFSTETESIKQSQVVLIAEVEYSNANDKLGVEVREEIGKINANVNKGMNSKVGNMFFQQYLLDDDRADRENRLDAVNAETNKLSKIYR
ncbi:MAG: hypothetical protein IJW35_07900 [Lentisphaeria bacterium]|nr:hypothetical protein [Lentisphaeria bacterium]